MWCDMTLGFCSRVRMNGNDWLEGFKSLTISEYKSYMNVFCVFDVRPGREGACATLLGRRDAASQGTHGQWSFD